MKRAFAILLVAAISASSAAAEPQFEFTNNFLQNLSFITGTNRGMAQNLDDNFGWMKQQGYTHLRFFGIFPNGYYTFPSPTLESNGFPTHPYFVSVLELLVEKADQHGIVINFDGWEVIAESNYDTTVLGVGFITEAELASVVQDVLDLGVNLITEEQFGGGYIQAIQSTTAASGASHETTTVLWWQSEYASLIADQQLGNAFSFYPFNQAEVDSVIGGGFHQSYPANLGLLHIIMESARHYNIPTSIAVGSFGTFEPHSWKNVLLFAQLLHTPDRFSIEESDTDMLIWDPEFNFREYVGNDIVTLQDQTLTGRPIANLVYDLSTLYTESFYPTWFASIMNASAIVNALTSMGYKVVASTDSVLEDADIYFLLLTGGAEYPDIVAAPDYVMPLLGGSKPVLVQPTFGIPDHGDDPSWIPLREYFGLSSGETQTLANSIPATVIYKNSSVCWGGIQLHLTPLVEKIPVAQVDTGIATVSLSADISQEDIALIIQRRNKFLINSNLIHLGAAYILSDLLGGPINSPTLADITIADNKALVFAEHDTDVDIDIGWSGASHLLRYDPYGTLIMDLDTAIGDRFTAELLQGELLLLFGNNDFLCGDANGDETINISDAVYLINYIFKGGPPPDPHCEGDAGGDGSIDISDAVYLVNYIFKGGPPPAEDCCR